MSRKKKKQEKQERLAIKDFFDRILPGVLKFYSDHYICGDSYRCVWAIREYPPSTEEQAILSQLADRSHIFYSKEDLLFSALQVREFRWGYCKPMDERFLQELNRKRPQTMRAFQKIWYGGEDGSNSLTGGGCHGDRGRGTIPGEG